MPLPYVFGLGIIELVLLAATVPLGLLAIPLAVRQARPALWWAYTLLGFALAVGLPTLLDRLLFHRAVPLWSLLLVYSVGCLVLPLGIAWCARSAARAWSTRRWSMTSLVVVVGVAASSVVAVRLSYALHPAIIDIVEAVK